MGRPREFDEEDVVDQAMEVFWRQGYEATSLEDLTERTGLSKSSLYQTFGSKRGLFDAALDRYHEVITAMALRRLEEGDLGLQDVQSFFTMSAEAARDPMGQLGCLMVNSIGELGATNAWLEPVTVRYRERVHAAFVSALERAIERGELPKGDVDDKAWLLTTLHHGVAVLQRGNPNAVIETVGLEQGVAETLDAWRRAKKGKPATTLASP